MTTQPTHSEKAEIYRTWVQAQQEAWRRPMTPLWDTKDEQSRAITDHLAIFIAKKWQTLAFKPPQYKATAIRREIVHFLEATTKELRQKQTDAGISGFYAFTTTEIRYVLSAHYTGRFDVGLTTKAEWEKKTDVPWELAAITIRNALNAVEKLSDNQKELLQRILSTPSKKVGTKQERSRVVKICSTLAARTGLYVRRNGVRYVHAHALTEGYHTTVGLVKEEEDGRPRWSEQAVIDEDAIWEAAGYVLG